MPAGRHGRIRDWLARNALIAPEDLLDTDSRLCEFARRNRLFEYRRKSGSGLFVKQTASASRGGLREARAVAYVRDAILPQDMRQHLPVLLCADAVRGLIAFDRVGGCVTLSEHLRRRRRCPSAALQQVGRFLAALHEGSGRSDRPARWHDGEIRPWILHVDRPTDQSRAESSHATEVLWSYLRRDTSLAVRISGLADGWRRDCFIHGDARLDNILSDSGRGRAANQRTVVVDWELASPGDAAWDVACLFASFLELWARSLRDDAAEGSDKTVENPVDPRSAMIPFAVVTGALNDIWRPYASMRGIAKADPVGFAVHCTEFIAARLVQHALETTQAALHPPPSAYRLLQLAENILQEPKVAAFRFLGVAWLDA